MRIKNVRVSDKGQISIPQDIREELGINKGDDILIIQEGDNIMIKKSSTFSKSLKNEFGDLVKHSEKTAKKFWSNEKDDIWDTV